MMWIWAIALGATLAGLALALRALVGADTAVADLRRATEAVRVVPIATMTLEAATAEAAARQTALGERLPPSS